MAAVDTSIGSISAQDYYRMIRAQIEHEDNLIAQRLSWFVAAQSFLFSAYAISLNAPAVTSALQGFSTQTRLLNLLIPMVAILICSVIYITLIGGILALRNLRQSLARNVPAEAIAHLPPVQGMSSTRLMGHTAPLLLPPMIGFVWLALLLHFVL